MEYLCLIYGDEQAWTNLSNAEREAMEHDYSAFNERIQNSGHYKGGRALETSDTATLVRVRDGKTATTDGPYAETKEQLGGYYLIEARDLDDAIAVAARIPDARNGTIEIRPIPQRMSAPRKD